MVELKIAILPDLVVQRKLFDATHRKQLESIGDVIYNRTEGKPSPETLKDTIAGADLAVTSWGCTPLTKEILDRAPRLRAVVHAAGTVKPVVTPELWSRGIRVASCNDSLAVGVAESALALTIASLKNMWRLSQITREGGWGQGRELVRELYGLTVGVIGAGKAGRHYIRLLRQFSVDILVYDPFSTAEEIARTGAVKAELNELLAASDVVSLHAPSIPSTHHLINRERLLMMKDDAILINTARGSIVDEAALVEQLQQGRLFACLDVTAPEPPASDHPFRSLPNCIVTPHIAGAVNNGIKRLGQFAVEELGRLVRGAPLLGEVKPEQLETMA
ncbi:hydroxyacid dehydrogenase [Paenibacillus oceani]|uniref:Hydroxyacid dehydrogenase n=1 Tax=Paenibacillus oceani TaxID=2772510 RepID=A0A927C3W3_9BACL|nr:hydroxyacid dehydrogenase [Paenibacillus oceani]MBD2860849.1 hydroxyacid dehydrogenase [Paenibacillus oceani]